MAGMVDRGASIEWLSQCVQRQASNSHSAAAWHAPPRSKYEALTVVVLKEKLRERSLKVSGRKAELVDRLLEADARVLEGA